MDYETICSQLAEKSKVDKKKKKKKQKKKDKDGETSNSSTLLIFRYTSTYQ